MKSKLLRKMLFAVLLIIAVCSASFSILSYNELTHALHNQLRSDGISLVRTIKRELYSHNVTDITRIHEIFKEVVEHAEGNILFVSITDENLNVLASNSYLPGVTQIDSMSKVAAETERSLDFTNQNPRTYEVNMNNGLDMYTISGDFVYEDGKTGSVNLGLSLTNMKEEIVASFIQIITVSLVIAGITFCIVLFASNKFIKPIVIMANKVQEFATGNFQVDFTHNSKDEIGLMSNSLNGMRDSLSDVIISIRENSKSVLNNANSLSSIIKDTTVASQGITISSSEVSHGANDLAETAADGLERLNSLANEIQGLSISADHIKSSIENTKKANTEGSQKIVLLEKSIEDYELVNSEIKKQVDSLIEKFNHITKFTGVIKTIAEQTKLLALNARIESAKAGDNGKGFTVVADEINKLSKETAKSIEEIEELVKQVHNAIRNTNTQMDKGNAVVKVTHDVASSTKSSLEIVDEAVSSMIIDILNMTSGVDKVNTEKNTVVESIEGIAAIAEESSAATEEITSSIEQQLQNMENASESSYQLEKIANTLDVVLDKFKL